MTQDDLTTAKTTDLLAELSRRFDDLLFVGCVHMEGKREFAKVLKTDSHMFHALMNYLETGGADEGAICD